MFLVNASYRYDRVESATTSIPFRMREGKVALITGTTSNLGINIAFRLLDQLPNGTNITLIVTSRTLPRVKEVIADIQKYYRDKHPNRSGELEFDYLLVDFTNMVSVLSAFHAVEQKFTKIDYVFINAAHGVYSGIDWMQATKAVFTNILDAVTFPTYKLQKVGVKSVDDIGVVFQGNVFGPYYFLHRIRHLLEGGARVVWISSVMASPKYLSFDDLQLLKSPEPYEGSKRFIDLLHCGTFRYLSQKYNIKSYVVHPGIFTSFSFFEFLNVFTYYGMMILFYIARLLGSQIHNISGYTAANAPVTVALNDCDQSVKWVSACNRWGREFTTHDEIESTGAEDVVAFIDKLVGEWDEKLRSQITETRKT